MNEDFFSQVFLSVGTSYLTWLLHSHFEIQPYLEIELKLCFNRAGRYVSGCATYLSKAREMLRWILFTPSLSRQVLGCCPWDGCLCLCHFTTRVCIEKDWQLLCAEEPREELNVIFTWITIFQSQLLIISYLPYYCWLFCPLKLCRHVMFHLGIYWQN